MQKSDFILLIKKQSDKLVEAWNNNNDDIFKSMANMQILIGVYACLYEKDVTVFKVTDMDDNHSLKRLCDLTEMLLDCRKKLEASISSTKDDLSDEQRQELRDSRDFVLLEIENLQVTGL